MDFCCESLGTSVNASQVSSDGYEVGNLISSNVNAKRAGFIAERFIKPPVDIEFTFACEVQLNYIHLVTSIGSQRTVGIDLCSYVDVPKNHTSVKTPKSSAGGEEMLEVFLGKCFIESETENEVVFVNRSFVNRTPFDKLQTASVPSCRTSRNMRLVQAAGVNRAVKIKIRLWKTANGSLATLGKVIINGIPNRQVNEGIIQRLLTVIRQKSNSVDSIKCQQMGSSSSGSRVSSSGSGLKTTPSACGDVNMRPDVPDDFLDSITCELMSYPVVLPSGNVVDQTTLDKHIAAEAVWGRPPSDPFTGMTFTIERRPLPNVALKSRIDRFLLNNSNMESTLTANGRTTGKRKREDDVFPTKFANHFQNALVGHSESQSCASVQTDHESELSRSLNEALTSLTEHINSANVPSKSLTVFQQPSVCVSCEIATKNSAAFYRMPCNHEMCRDCISVGQKSTVGDACHLNRCPLCKTSYPSSDIRRSY